MWYAVHKGHRPGIYATWKECQQQVHKFPGAEFKKFASESAAAEFVTKGLQLRLRVPGKAAKRVAPAVMKAHKRAKKTSVPSSLTPKLAADEIYSDGACSGNPGPCGAAAKAWFADGRTEHKIWSSTYGTNNAAELHGLRLAIELAQNAGSTVVIRTDSRFALNMVTGQWRSGQKSRHLAELIQTIRASLQIVRAQREVHIEWVKAHADNERNCKVDELAREAVPGSTSLSMAATEKIPLNHSTSSHETE